MGSKAHVVLEVFEVVTHQVSNYAVLLHKLVLQVLIMTLESMELLLESLDPFQQFSLHDHRIVHTVHPIFSLKNKLVDKSIWIHSLILPSSVHPPWSGTTLPPPLRSVDDRC